MDKYLKIAKFNCFATSALPNPSKPDNSQATHDYIILFSRDMAATDNKLAFLTFLKPVNYSIFNGKWWEV